MTTRLDEKAFRISKKAAFEAGEIQKRYFSRGVRIQYKDTSPNLVSVVDFKCEDLILKQIRKSFPDHNIVTEETDLEKIPSDYTWYIDPLDGTVNYLKGLPFFCVSIALSYKNRIILSVVHSVLLNETFTARRGKGAFLNGKRIRPGSCRVLKEAFLVTGFPYTDEGRLKNLVYFNEFIMNSMAVRRVGSAALDLCYVGKGVFDGFWEIDLKPWDVAGGMLVVEEAGGKITNFRGGKCYVDDKEIIASNGLIHNKMVKILKRYKR